MATNLIFSYHKSIANIGPCDGEFRFQQALDIPKGSRCSYRISRASIPVLVPNCYSYTDDTETFSNAVFAISFDDGVTFTQWRLNNGSYTIYALRDAIRAIDGIRSHFNDVAAGLSLYANPTLGNVFWTIDETQLVDINEKIVIDMHPTIETGIAAGQVSQFYQLLGFDSNPVIAYTGTHVGDTFARLNWQGDEVSISLAGLASNLSYSFNNGVQSSVALTVSLGQPIRHGNNYVAQLFYSEAFSIDIVPPITGFTMRFTNVLGKRIIVMSGVVSCDIVFRYL